MCTCVSGLSLLIQRVFCEHGIDESLEQKWFWDFLFKSSCSSFFPPFPFLKAEFLGKVESKILIGSRKKWSREIGSQKSYFSKELLKRSTAFDSRFPDSTSFESRLESLTLLPPQTLPSKRGRGKKTKNMNSQNKNLKPAFARKLSLACDLRSIKCDPANAFSRCARRLRCVLGTGQW